MHLHLAGPWLTRYRPGIPVSSAGPTRVRQRRSPAVSGARLPASSAALPISSARLPISSAALSISSTRLPASSAALKLLRPVTERVTEP